MTKQRILGNGRTPRTGHRSLRSEQLERREMLAADLLNMGAALSPVCTNPDGPINSAYVASATAGLQAKAASTRGGGSVGNNGSANVGQGTPVAPVAQGELSQAEEDSLLHMREEEKLAQDVYITLEQQWNDSTFGNIAAAESQHMEAVGKLIDRYGLEDPIGENGLGEFTNPEFQTLYADLVAKGSESLIDAYQVGALIEELDIVDLQNALEDVVTHDDIDLTYENLMRGSRNHLRAFAAQLEAEGEPYVVDGNYLTQAEFDAIADSPRETGSGQDQGQAGRPNRDTGNGNGGRGQRAGNRVSGSQAQDRTSRHDRVRQDRAQHDREQTRIRTQVKNDAATAAQDRIRDRLFSQLGTNRLAGLQGGHHRR